MQSNPLILLLLNLNQWNKTEGQLWDQQGEMLHRIPGASVLFTKWACQDAVCSFYSAAAALIVSYNTKGEKRPNRMKLSFSITLQPSSTFHFSRKPNHLHTRARYAFSDLPCENGTHARTLSPEGEVPLKGRRGGSH